MRRELEEIQHLLADQGLDPVAHEDRYLEFATDRVLVTIEERPSYCDRGSVVVKAFRTDPLFTLDPSDGFPRYYFGSHACASELIAWLAARGLRAPATEER